MLKILAIIFILSLCISCFAQQNNYTNRSRSLIIINTNHINPSLVADIFGGNVIWNNSTSNNSNNGRNTSSNSNTGRGNTNRGNNRSQNTTR